MTSHRVNDDHHWMALAIRMAHRGRFSAAPRRLVGCLLVREGQALGRGIHLYPDGADALTQALDEAAQQAEGATLYTTHVPDPSWCARVIDAGCRELVIADADPGNEVALARLRAAGVAVRSGLLQQEAARLNEAHTHRLATGRPQVTVKLAMSLDGRTALANGHSQWITGPASRADVHRQRAQACAILSGADTVLSDDALLNVRWPPGTPYPAVSVRQPLRVVIDSRCRLMPSLKLFSIETPVALAQTAADSRDWPVHVERWCCQPTDAGKVDLGALMQRLGQRQLNSVWVEAGATLAGALLQQRLVDRLVVYVAPKLMGSQSRGLLELPCFTEMDQLPLLRLADVRQLGDDLKITYQPE